MKEFRLSGLKSTHTKNKDVQSKLAKFKNELERSHKKMFFYKRLLTFARKETMAQQKNALDWNKRYDVDGMANSRKVLEAAQKVEVALRIKKQVDQ
jgi:hypothetical protein